MDRAANALGFKIPIHTTEAELQKILTLFNATEIPHPTAELSTTTTPSLPIATPVTPALAPLRRSQRLLLNNKPQPQPQPPNRVVKKGSPRRSPCRTCKGKQKATPVPVQIRMTMTSKLRFTDEEAVTRVRMGFRFLPDANDAGDNTTMVLVLGTDIVADELVGLDMMEVDVRLGFAAE